MKVRAKVNVKYNGKWYRPGEVFEADAKDIAGMMGPTELVTAPRPFPAKPKREAPKEETHAEKAPEEAKTEEAPAEEAQKTTKRSRRR